MVLCSTHLNHQDLCSAPKCFLLKQTGPARHARGGPSAAPEGNALSSALPLPLCPLQPPLIHSYAYLGMPEGTESRLSTGKGITPTNKVSWETQAIRARIDPRLRASPPSSVSDRSPSSTTRSPPSCLWLELV